MKNLIRIAAVTLALGVSTSAVQARSEGGSLVRDAHRVVDDANQLTREVNLHFRHTAEYRHLLSDAAKIRQKSQHIDQLSHHVHGIDDVRHLKADLRDLDELVHHVADLIEDIDGCRTHGDTRHVKSLVADMNRSLHSMERTVSYMERQFRSRCDYESSRGRSDHGRSDRGRSDRGRSDRGRSSSVRYSSSRSFGEHVVHSVLRDVLGHR